jgi:cyclase
VDELVLLDIRASTEGRGPNLDIIRDISGECFMPLTIGGGITSLEQVREILRAGADKVAINTGAFENPRLIENIAKEFGTQCCVASIDVIKNNQKKYEVCTKAGKNFTGKSPIDWAREVEQLGAGEILLNSIDLDGTMKGYDINLLRSVSEAVNIPVIAAGGAGVPEHFNEVFKKTKISAVAAASIFHFTNHTPADIKKSLSSQGISVRI